MDMIYRLRQLLSCIGLLLFLAMPALAQSIRVHGVVRDSRGTPLPRVSITTKASNKLLGSTDSVGTFSIQTEERSVLLFSLQGKKQLEVLATPVRLQLTLEDAEEQGSQVTTMRQATSIQSKYYPLWVIDGVVYRQDSTFNTADLASPDAKRLIAAALPGLSEQDIEGYQVISDASATSLYGNQAMGGVIAVRTRRAGQGTSHMTYTSQLTYRFIPSYRDFNIMNSQDQMAFLRELEAGGNLTPANILYQSKYGVYGWLYDNVLKYRNGKFTQDNTEEGRLAYLAAAEQRNTDWFRELYQHSIRHQHTVSLSSGTQRANFYTSIGADLDPGWAKDEHSKRYFFNLNATYRPHAHWTFNAIANATYRQEHAGGDFKTLTLAQSMPRQYDPKLYYLYEYAPLNAKQELKENYMDLQGANLRFQASLRWQPIPQLSASILGSIQYSGSETEYIRTENSNVAKRYRAMQKRLIRDNNSYLYKPADDVYAIPQSVMPYGGLRNISSTSDSRLDLQGRLSYSDEWSGRHQLSATAGFDLYDQTSKNGWHDEYGVNFAFGELATFDPLAFTWLRDANNNYYYRLTQLDRNVSFLANFAYTYLGRYSLEGSMRYEGTNRFGASRTSRWTPTWNVALGWDLGRESFFSHLQPLSSLSTKIAYGMTGTLPFVYNSNRRIIAELPYRPNKLVEPGLTISEPTNRDLTYERMYELNWELHLGLWRERVSLGLNLYQRQGRDLMDVSYNQGTGGFFRPYANVASMEAHGLELSLTTHQIQTKDFEWTTNFSYTHSANKVTKLNARPSVSVLTSSSGAAREGYPLSSIFSVPFHGLSSEGFPLFRNADGKVTRDRINFSQTTDLDYLVYSGTRTPTDQGGLTNSFRIGNVRLSVYLLYAMGHVRRLPTQFSSQYYDHELRGKEFNRRWIRPGDEATTDVPSIPTAAQLYDNATLSRAYRTYNYSDVRIAPLDYVQLRDISVNYSIPRRLLTRGLIHSIDLKLQASNVALLYSSKKLNGALPYDYRPHALIFTCVVGI